VSTHAPRPPHPPASARPATDPFPHPRPVPAAEIMAARPDRWHERYAALVRHTDLTLLALVVGAGVLITPRLGGPGCAVVVALAVATSLGLNRSYELRALGSGPAAFRRVVAAGGASAVVSGWPGRPRGRLAGPAVGERCCRLGQRRVCGGGREFKLRADPRVTRVGATLHCYSLDELPQLSKVLTGSMSLVRPRPPLPGEVAGYANDARRRLLVEPGMTGLCQVSGRSDLSWEESVRLDLRYVENWIIALDAEILVRTEHAMVRGDGAY
jgi:hypothetical protein